MESILAEQDEHPNPDESAARTTNNVIESLFIVPHLTVKSISLMSAQR
jgi:hypothetical protein